MESKGQVFRISYVILLTFNGCKKQPFRRRNFFVDLLGLLLIYFISGYGLKYLDFILMTLSADFICFVDHVL